MKSTSFLGVSSKRFNPWVGKIPWRRKWQSTPVLLPGKFHGQRSLVGYSSWGHKELDMTERLHFLKGQTAKAQEPPRGATPRPRSGAAAGSYPMPPSPRPGAAAGRSNPTLKARGGGPEDQPHVQGAVAAGAGVPRGAIPR